MDTGEQGLREVTYEDADDASENWVAVKRAKELLDQWEPDDADEETTARVYEAVIGRAPDVDDNRVLRPPRSKKDVLAADEARAVIDLLELRGSVFKPDKHGETR